MYSPLLLFCPRCSIYSTLQPFFSHSSDTSPKACVQEERQP